MFLDVNLVKRISEDSIARKDFTWVFFFSECMGMGDIWFGFCQFYSICKSMIMVKVAALSARHENQEITLNGFALGVHFTFIHKIFNE